VITIQSGGLDDPAVQALLAYHHREARRLFPSEFAHALPPEALHDPAVRFFSAWEDDALLGIAALKRIDDRHAEVKSMRTHPDRLRRGAARLLLDRVIAEARAGGYARLSLETGVGAPFVAANALYERAGFVDCAAFASYPPSPHNRFMTLALTGAALT
jgi:putative acetyltransferase